VETSARTADWIKLCYQTQKIGSQVVSLSTAPVVTGPGASDTVSGVQITQDSAQMTYEVGDPDNATVTISAQYEPLGGSWTAMSNTAGAIGAGIAANSPSTNRVIKWGVRAQLGSSTEGFYYGRVIASDGTYHTRKPLGLANLVVTDSNANSISLSWTTATDADFSCYQIYYGLVRSDVAAGAGTAMKWDTTCDATLKSKSTNATTITGLTGNATYYFKIWAFDTWGNNDTAQNMSGYTRNQTTPRWSRTSIGTVLGGAIGDSAEYVGAGANAYSLYAINAATGATKWSYSTTPNVCNMPTGTMVVGRQDNGASSSQLFTPINLGATAGNPYASPDDSSFYVAYTGNLTKRNIATGAALWTASVPNISTSADPVVSSDWVYVAGTDGVVSKGDSYDFTPLSTFNAGASVQQPLLMSGDTLYVAPASASLYAVRASTMAQVWQASLGAANSGPPFTQKGASVIYVATGTAAQQVTTAGAVTKTYAAGATIQSGPIEYNGTVYLGSSDGQYHAFDASSQAEKTTWPFTYTSGNASAGPVIDTRDTLVIFGTTGGNLNAFKLQ
jgi:outer membrane protein assembly factor BamB